MTYQRGNKARAGSVALTVLILTLGLAVKPSSGQAQTSPFAMPVPAAGHLVAITNATIMTASHGTIQRGTIIIRDGRIAEIGENLQVPAGAQVIDACACR